MSETELLVLAAAVIAVILSVLVVRAMRSEAAPPPARPPRRRLRQPPPRRTVRDEVDEALAVRMDEAEAFTLPSSGRVQVVGESHYQPELAAAAGGRSERGHELECVVGLFRQPENPYDANAIAVAVLGGGVVGYLSREDAVAYRGVFLLANSNGLLLASRAQIRGGWDRGYGERGHFGIVLRLSGPDACMEAVLEAIRERSGAE